MYFDFLVDIPVSSKIVSQTKKGVTYVDFEYDRIYNKAKKYTIPKRSTIGKISPDDTSKMWPNQNYMKYFPGTILPEKLNRSTRSGCLRVGAYIVIRKLIEQAGISGIIKNYFNQKDLGLLLDLVIYTIITENNAAQYYPDYAFCHPLLTSGMAIYSDSKISDFLHGITVEQQLGFLEEWNKKKDHREKIYISYDSTNKNCQAGDVDFAEYGYAKDDESKPIINYSIAYDVNNRDPLFYEEYPGSINDMSQLQFMVKKAIGYGYRHIGFILDRGYFHKRNLDEMDKNGYGFIIMLKGMKTMVRDLIRSVSGTFEKKRTFYFKEYDVSGITIIKKLFTSDEKERYIHLFYSLSRENKERREFEDDLKKMSDTMKKHEGEEVEFTGQYKEYFDLYYQEEKEKVHGEDGTEREILKKKTFLFAVEKSEKIEEETNLMGYFAIVTSDKMSAKEAIKLYKGRDASEKLFRADKSYLDEKSYRGHSNETVASKVFIAFIALIIRNRMHTALQEEMIKIGSRPNYMNVPAALRELEKIEMVRLPDNVYQQDHAISKTQKVILNSFGMDENYIQYRIEQIQKELIRIDKEASQRKGAS